MIKLNPIFFAFIGITVTGIGFGFLSKYEFQTIGTYEQKYSSSILDLNGDEDIGKLRMELMRSTTPDNLELREASKQEATKSLAVLKKVCGRIYKTNVNHRQYMDDFKKYCTKHNEDIISEKDLTVIRTGVLPNKNSLIDSKLEALKKHKKALDGGLASIKNSKDTQEARREAIKVGCTNAAESLYEGPSSTKSLNFLTYCVKENLTTI